MKAHLKRPKGRKTRSPLPPTIDKETILSVLTAAMDHPKKFFVPTLEVLKKAHEIMKAIDPHAHFHHLSDPKMIAIITMVAQLVEAQKVTDTPPVAPCKCR